MVVPRVADAAKPSVGELHQQSRSGFTVKLSSASAMHVINKLKSLRVTGNSLFFIYGCKISLTFAMLLAFFTILLTSTAYQTKPKVWENPDSKRVPEKQGIFLRRDVFMACKVLRVSVIGT